MTGGSSDLNFSGASPGPSVKPPLKGHIEGDVTHC